jgi:hypothetical protein
MEDERPGWEGHEPMKCRGEMMDRGIMEGKRGRRKGGGRLGG